MKSSKKIKTKTLKTLRAITLCLFFIFCTHCRLFGQNASMQHDYLNEVFEIIEKHSIRKDSVDFQELKSKAFGKLSTLKSKSIKACHPIVQGVLTDLGDNHSFFMPPSRVTAWKTTSKSTSRSKLITFSGKVLKDSIGYIHMRGFSSGDPVSLKKYADSLQSLIRSIDTKELKGWILDLRENTGGNCWPMLAGLGPLLGNGICGYFIDNRGQRSSWFYEDGAAGINENTFVKTSIEPYTLIDQTKPIALLSGRNTVSSGEVVFTAFRKKENMKSFGEKTAGLSTGNANFKLSDGSMILLTTTFYADREGAVVDKNLKPDKEIKFSYARIGKRNDPVIKEAVEWITKK